MSRRPVPTVLLSAVVLIVVALTLVALWLAAVPALEQLGGAVQQVSGY